MVEDPDAIAILNCLAQFIDRHTTSAAIPHIYVSGFVLAPHSLLRTLYAPNRTIEYTDIPIDSFGLSKIWSSERLTIQSLSCNPSRLCFISKRSLVNRDWRQTEISYDGTVQCERWLRGSFPPDWHGIPIERHTSSTISRDLTKLACTNGQVLNFTYATRMSHTKRISGAKPVFHPTNSNLLAYIRIGGIICIYDLTETPRIRIQFQTDARQSSLLVWSPDGIYLASNTGWSGHTTVWKIDYITNTAALNGESNFRCHPLCFQPTRQSRILVQSDEGMISLLDFTSGDIDIHKTYDFSKFIDMNTSTGATFSPDGSTFATFQQRSDTVVVFETETGKRYRDPIVTPSPVIRVDYLPDGKRFILVCEQRYYLSETQIYIADVHADLCVSEEDRFNYANKMGQLKGITSACFSPDGRKFLTSSRDGTVHVRSTTDCMLLREYWPLEHSSAVLCAVFSIDGNSIYCALMDGTVRTSSGKTLYTTKGGTHVFSIKAYMSDSLEERVVVIERDRIVVVSGEGTLIHGPYKIGGTYARVFSVSHHGLLAYTDENRDKVLFLNLGAEYSPSSLQMRHETVDAMSLSRDGSVLALWGAPSDRKKPVLDVWDVNTGTVLRSIALQLYFVGPLQVIFLDISYLPLFNNHRSLIFVFMQGETLTSQTWNLEDDSDSPAIHHSTTISDFRRRYKFSLSPNGRNLVMASIEGIVMWDLALLEGDNDHAPHSSAASAENSIHSSTMPVNWRMERDAKNNAWIIGPNRERLLWVPSEFWRELDPPGSTHVIRRRRRKLDFSRFVHGEDWVKCYQPLEDEEASD